MDATGLIEALGLRAHPEGGWFRPTWRAPSTDGRRPSGSAIYYLLKSGERSARHRVDATEIWHYYAGGPLELGVARYPGDQLLHVLGPDVGAGARPQVVVPAGAWQWAQPLGSYCLVGCTVSPGFEWAGFELDGSEAMG